MRIDVLGKGGLLARLWGKRRKRERGESGAVRTFDRT